MFDRNAFDEDQSISAIIDRSVQLARTPGQPAKFQGAGRGITAVTTTPDLTSWPDPETGESIRCFTLDIDSLDSNARLL